MTILPSVTVLDSTTTSYNDDEAPINSTLSYYIKAIDSYGRESAANASVSVATEEYGNNKEEAALLEYDNCSFSGQINYAGDDRQRWYHSYRMGNTELMGYPTSE